MYNELTGGVHEGLSRDLYQSAKVKYYCQTKNNIPLLPMIQ